MKLFLYLWVNVYMSSVINIEKLIKAIPNDNKTALETLKVLYPDEFRIYKNKLIVKLQEKGKQVGYFAFIMSCIVFLSVIFVAIFGDDITVNVVGFSSLLFYVVEIIYIWITIKMLELKINKTKKL